MTILHKVIFLISCLIVLTALVMTLYYHEHVYQWVSANLWLVVVPFLKVAVKRVLALKLVVFLKVLWLMFYHLLKLLLIKLLKTLALRYGVFFSQRRWRWVRYFKVVSWRRGRHVMHALKRFWGDYSQGQRRIVLIAFFPVIAVLFLLGFSFDLTYKAMVQKREENLIVSTVNGKNINAIAGVVEKRWNLKGWIEGIDKRLLIKIKDLSNDFRR